MDTCPNGLPAATSIDCAGPAKADFTGTTYYLYPLGSTIPLFELNAAGATTAINTVGADGLVSRKNTTNNTFYQFDLSMIVAREWT